MQRDSAVNAGPVKTERIVLEITPSDEAARFARSMQFKTKITNDISIYDPT
jgi:stress response protein YsnF